MPPAIAKLARACGPSRGTVLHQESLYLIAAGAFAA